MECTVTCQEHMHDGFSLCLSRRLTNRRERYLQHANHAHSQMRLLQLLLLDSAVPAEINVIKN